MGRCCPVPSCVAIHIAVSLVQETLFAPYQLWSIPYSTTVDARLLHHCTDAGTARIFLAVVLAQQLLQRVVPAAVVVAHTVVFGQSRDEWSPADALIVIETAGMGVLIKE